MKTPRLSIITVCLNEERAIQKTVRSVVEQTFNDYELIIIDGGSSDATLDAIEKHRTDRFVVVSEPDEGLYDAMNKGVLLAQGDYVYFLNGGDYLVSEDVLKCVFAAIDEDDGYGLYYGQLLIYNSETGRGRVKRQFEFANTVRLFGRTLPHQATFIRRSLFLDLGLYDTTLSICGDYEWFLRAVIKGRTQCKYFNKLIAVFNLNGISSSSSNYAVHKRERQEVQRRHIPKWQYVILRAKILYSILFASNRLFYAARRALRT
jgi:glycosyltransferase involved in cell wall biosynthesis